MKRVNGGGVGWVGEERMGILCKKGECREIVVKRIFILQVPGCMGKD